MLEVKPYEPYLATDNSWLYVFLGPELFLPSEGVGHGHLVGRAGGRFVVYVYIEDPDLLGEDHPLRGLKKEGRALWGLALAKPVIRRRSSLEFAVERPYEGSFRHICIPPLGESRWWVYKVYVTWELLKVFNEEHVIYILDGGRVYVYKGVDKFDMPHWPMSYCKAVLGVRFGLVRREDVKCCEDVPRLWPSPLGSPMSIPGSGSLVGAELPVVRRQFGYLRVGSWLAWHRVLGLLDGGGWVLLGDDGLYEAVFTPTVKEPLEVFGEVGYVKVLKPYEGDVDDVASPCGAPRLVACVEDTREALVEAGHRCEAEDGIPHVFLGTPYTFGLGREAIDWPLADPCTAGLHPGELRVDG
ncbi:MAG: hypothetical protein ACO2PN_25065 [Pyrobaculum sp.]